MNIFIIGNTHEKIAYDHVDKHVSKMILESTQMLSTNVRLSGYDAGYKMTHQNHPCTIWARESIVNHFWVLELIEALHDAWRFRYGHPSSKVHKSYEVAMSLPLPANLPEVDMTPFALCMPDIHKVGDVVESYRHFYNFDHDKRKLHKWKHNDIPNWIVSDQEYFDFWGEQL